MLQKRPSITVYLLRKPSDNRGVVLLIVLGLLAMLGLIGISFVLLSGHARRSAVAQARASQTDNPPDRLAENVIMQVLHGTDNPASVLRSHSLLEDLYGNRFAKGHLLNDPTEVVPGGQLLQFEPSADIDEPYKYVGCVLTITSGQAKGYSTRVVGYLPGQGFQILRINSAAQPKADDTFIINGTPFSGTGFGYDPDALPENPLLSSQDPEVNQPYALLPNPRYFSPNGSYDDPSGPGGANEDYDAADYQNMLLALLIPQAGKTPNVVVPIPSLHRPSLLNYWFHRLAGPPANPNMSSTWNDLSAELKFEIFLRPYGPDCRFGTDDDPQGALGLEPSDVEYLVNLKRRIIMRPLREDHPDFTGGNAYADLDILGITDEDSNNIPDFYPWDVDNDGDGIMDSIWVDVGLPVRTTKDGRQYKPLAAILCIDLDGRLNLNAHGNLAQANVETTGGIKPGAPQRFYSDQAMQLANIIAGGHDTSGSGAGPFAVNVVRGQGVGPAEINLGSIVGDRFRQLLCGDGMTEGRYGEVNPAVTQPLPSPGVTGDDSGWDVLCKNRKLHRPARSDALSSYGSPVDSKGTMAVCLDLRGQPLYDDLTDKDFLTSDDPYDLNLSQNAGISLPSSSELPPGSRTDNPFSVAELETLLRPFDSDSSLLPPRLPILLQGLNLHDIRHELSTSSWSLPCPSVTLVIDSNASPQSQTNYSHVVEIITSKGVAADQVHNLISPDLLAGLRMDINRAFGDGIDNPIAGMTNNVVDEPEESPYAILRQQDCSGNPIRGTDNKPLPLDLDNDGITDDQDNQIQARQLFARHLYVLAMAVIDLEGLRNSYSPRKTDEEIAHMIAQWAVNVVDFRDSDSIMTGFEYDVYPFASQTAGGNPWEVNGDLIANEPEVAGTVKSGVVWGCERPEMLITETLAFHDRRTQDLDTDESGKNTAAGDPHFDQQVKPQGSLFIELYNPWTGKENRPAELYATMKIDGVDHKGIDLRATAGNSPVWRMIVVDGTNADDPDDPALETPVAVERSIYYVTPGDGFSAPSGDCMYSPDSENMPEISLLMPGRYAVVGPGTDNGASTTYIGFRKNKTPDPPIEKYQDTNTRRIVLTPSSNPNIRQVSVFIDGGPHAENDDLHSLTNQNPIAIVINPADLDSGRSMRLSVSEPTDGYPSYDDALKGIYDPPINEPFAVSSNDPAKLGAGTTSRYRWIYLQRLANPLQPYKKHTNPYLSIDRAQIDLTAFNGMQDDSEADKTVKAATTLAYRFFSRERGEDEESAPLPKPCNLWATEIPAVASNPPMANATSRKKPLLEHNFNQEFAHTLGFLNEGFGASLNHPAGYEGSPPTPFPGWRGIIVHSSA